MTQTHQIAILFPLAASAAPLLCTIFVHALALSATVNFVRHEKRLGRVGAGSGINLTIVMPVVLLAFVAHLIGIGFWATLSSAVGNFKSSETPTTTQPSTTRPWATGICF